MRLLILAFLFYTPPVQAEIKVFFSPSKGCEELVVQKMNDAKTSLDIAVYTITNNTIYPSFAAAVKAGVKVRVLTDRLMSKGNWSKTRDIAAQGIPVKYNPKGIRIMHHKFVVIDGKALITGSFNWTESATKYNIENCIYLDDMVVATEYQDQFNAVWAKAQDK